MALVDTREGGAPNTTTATSLGNINSAPASIAKLSDAGLTAKTTISGIVDAADLTMTSVSGTSSIEGIAIFTQANSSRLIAWLDSGTGIPFTLNGGDITLAWSNGTSRIFMI